MGDPRRGYTNTHPPFEPGNTAAVRHGAWSPRLVERRAAEMVAAGELPTVEMVAAELAWIQAGDRWAIEAWLRALARVAMIDEWLAAHGLDDGEGGMREGVVRLLGSAEKDAAACAGRLGLDPSARARLAKDTAVARHFAADAIAGVAAAGASALQQNTARQLAAPTDEREVATDDGQVAHAESGEADSAGEGDPPLAPAEQEKGAETADAADGASGGAVNSAAGAAVGVGGPLGGGATTDGASAPPWTPWSAPRGGRVPAPRAPYSWGNGR